METHFMARLYESLLWRRNPLLRLLLGVNHTREYQIISRALELQGTETILDLACGPGVYTRRLAREAKQGSVFGVDVSRPMLNRGNELIRTHRISNISFLQGDALVLPFTQAQFDAVNCAAALHLFGDLATTFSEVHRILKPGGIFTFSTFRYPSDPLMQAFLSLRRNLVGIRSFRQEEIGNGLRQAGFGDNRILHAKGIWVIMSATKRG